MAKTKAERKKQTEAARSKREKDAVINDDILEIKVNEIPGLTYVQLENVFAKNMYQFKRTYLKNALQRLEDGKKILGLLVVSKEGKIVKTFVPNYSEQETTKKFNKVNIPVELITDKNKWKNVCFVYAIRNNEFVITPEKNNKFEDYSFHKSTAELIKSEEVITIVLTKPVIEYYQLNIDNVTWNIENDVITIIITPKLKHEKEDKKLKLQTKQKVDKKLNILLMEDSKYWGDAFYKGFTKAGHIVFRTDDFKIAEEITKSQNIDWMVLDDEIKLTKGAEKFFVKYKKKNKKYHGIFITSYPIPASRRKHLRDLGFESIIEKKIDKEERSPEEVAAEQIVRMEVV